MLDFAAGFLMRRAKLLWVVLLVAVVPATVQAEQRSYSLALESITRGELQQHVDVLADDTFEGREAGARGGYAAGGYIAKRLEQWGLNPAGDRGSYYQSFTGNGRNILTLLEGSDPRLKEEVVVVGGHYDHVGYGTQRNSYGPWGYIHNGADDNASGTAGLLELAQALSQLPEPPRRTILLAFWDAEEKGLIGSRHWVASPTISLTRVKCFLNVDMIGRLTNNRVEVYGIRSAAGLRRIVSHANTTGLDLDFTWQMRDDSDHWPFFTAGIPVLMLHTGLHADYHRPSDDAEKLNHEGLERVSRLMFETVYSLANTEELGAFRADARRETNDVRRLVEQPAAAPSPRLGMTWRKEASGEALQLLVVTINRGSAAEQAGLRVGDTVTQLDGQPIADDLVFRQQVLAAAAPLTLKVERTGEVPRLLRVNLHGTPIRVGITSRTDPVEPGVAIVSHVVYGSPAAAAGLRVSDRIDAVNGRPFTTAAEFSQLLDTPGESLTLRVERNGQVRDMELALAPTPPPAP